jgi:mannose/fructose/N-acetylgalactosamine-specific phosphotransferase system component IIC
VLIESSNPLNASEFIFPALECIHITGFALSIGTIAILDFRLLGLGLKRQPVAELARDLAPWTLAGLAIMLLSGPAMFSSDPDMYYLNISFQVKMALLLLALVFHYTIHRKAALQGAYARHSRLIACVSLALWMGVIAGGLFIGFVGDAIPQ